jgi:hypothetical protein
MYIITQILNRNNQGTSAKDTISSGCTVIVRLKIFGMSAGTIKAFAVDRGHLCKRIKPKNIKYGCYPQGYLPKSAISCVQQKSFEAQCSIQGVES